MKAKIKGTPFEVNVQPYYDSGQFIGFTDTETHSLLYNSEDLEFEKEFDWEAYRREAAKDLLPLAAELCDYRYGAKAFVKKSIELAEELIRQLKNTENTNDS